MPLFVGYRRSLGEDRHVFSAPGHLFDESEMEQLECLLGLSLYFFWDAYLFDDARTWGFKISHDEYMTLYAQNEQHLIQLKKCVEPYVLEEWTLNPFKRSSSSD